MDNESGGNSRHSYDALAERVLNQGQQIKELAESTTRQLISIQDSTNRQFTEFRSDVGRTIGDLSSALKGLDQKLDINATSINERGRTNWTGVLTLAGGAIGLTITLTQILGAMALAPTNNKVQGLVDGQLIQGQRLEQAVNKFVPREDIMDYRRATDLHLDKLETAVVAFQNAAVSKSEFEKTVSTMQANTDKTFANVQAFSDYKTSVYRRDVDKISKDVDDTQKEMVTRREHEQRWARYDQQLEHRQQQGDALSERVRQLEIQVGPGKR